jgi:hypothetical protein
MPNGHVLVLAPTPYFSERGCHIRIYEELKQIKALGYSAEVVTYALGRSIGNVLITRIAGLPWYHKTSAGPAWSKFILDWQLYRQAKRRIRVQRPRLLHTHLHEGMWVAWLLRHRFKIPVVLDLQSMVVDELASYGGIWRWIGRLVGWYERWAVHSADAVLVSSDQAFTKLQQRYPKAHFTLLRDGVPGSVPLKPIQFDLVYSGGLGAHKGTPLLEDALKIVLRARPSTRMLWITPQQPVPYEQLFDRLSECCFGIEPKPPTTTEGSGKLLNYLTAGVTPIYFAQASTAALASQAGYAVQEPTAAALAKTILLALDHPPTNVDRQRIQENAQQQHSWTHQASLLQSAYAYALGTA